VKREAHNDKGEGLHIILQNDKKEIIYVPILSFLLYIKKSLIWNF